MLYEAGQSKGKENAPFGNPWSIFFLKGEEFFQILYLLK